VRHEPKKLSVIIVNWNTKELLKNCLSSFIHNQYPFQLETIVVDNASTDGSSGMVQQQFPTVKLIQNAQNLGFAKANNVALQSTDADYFLLLNSDTIVKDDAFTELFWFMEKHPKVGVAGPKLLNSDDYFSGSLGYSFPGKWFERAISQSSLVREMVPDMVGSSNNPRSGCGFRGVLPAP